MSINKVILLGNVCRDPEVRTFDSGKKLASFSLATSKKAYTLQNGTQIAEQTEFHNIVIWGKLSDVIENYVKKGDKLFVEGELRTRSYEDSSGQKRYTTEIVANVIDMCGSKKKELDPVNPPEYPNSETEGSLDDLPF